MEKILVNFGYGFWNGSNNDHIVDDNFVVTPNENHKDVFNALKEVKHLCRQYAIVDAAGDNSDEYTLAGECEGTNPLDTEGDNAETLLRVAKSIGFIDNFERFCFDISVDFDAEL